MSQQTFIKEMAIGPHVVRLILQDQKPAMEWSDKLFSHIWLLADQLQELNQESYIKEFAEISNFCWKGTAFQFIDSISDYQKHYCQRVKLEQQHPADVFEYRLTDFKIFDVSVMHPPQLKQGQLTYFVYNSTNGLPYRVVCPFPYNHATSTLVHYQILPVLD